MTEKRFDAVEHGNHIIYRENGQNMWRNKVHVRLNELYDENQELKKELDQLYLLIGRGDWSGLVDLIIRRN